MSIESIIESINSHIEDIRKSKNIDTKGHLILHKTVLPHSTFKAYKTYTYTVWFIKEELRKAVINISLCENTAKVEEKSIIYRLEKLLFKEILNLFDNRELYKRIIEGTYK